MTDVVVDRLRIRGGGPHGRRLAGIAARLLPAALEQACADLPDAALGRLTVTLDLDPADHDDQTLATLWASRIRAAAIDAGARPVPRGMGGATAPAGAAGRGSDADAGASGDRGAPAHLRALLRRWLATGEVPADARGWLRVLASPVAAAGAVAGLRPAEVAALLALLATAGREGGDAGAPSPAAERAPGSVGAGTLGLGSGGDGQATVPEPAGRPADPDGANAAVPGGATPAGELPAARRLAAAAAAVLADPGAPGADEPGVAVTTVGGLVLLYPWLAEHCERACALHPGLDAGAVRRVALARLADPEQPWLVDDPVVLLLAGAPGQAPALLAPLPGLGEVDESAVGVLSSFAGLLPGFARSTPGYVRAGWIARLGTLDLAADPVRLTAGRRPLDVVLPRLPYPLGLLRLPWSPVVSVRFEP